MATAAATAALAVPIAVARAETATSAPGLVPGASLEAPSSSGEHKAPVEEGDALVPPPAPATKTPPPSGGVDAETDAVETGETETTETTPGATGAAPAPGTFAIPSLPSSSCAISGVPPVLIPIYQRASEQYGLGPQGPAILAGINAIETAFGQNLGPSYAGAEGWMQFMPETWAMYGVDANGDGLKDPNNPEDAIFAAARYLSAAGMPTDTYGAIFAYNHADWYVSEVLANAGCYAGEIGDTAFTAAGLSPQIEVLRCEAAPGWKKQIPAEYLEAFARPHTNSYMAWHCS